MRQGMVALMMVILVLVMSLFIMVGWQSRLLLAIQRSSSLSDLIAASYVAESEIYDWAARFIGRYPEMFVPPLDYNLREIKSETLPDGTEMLVQAMSKNNVETLFVTAERLYSTTKMELARSTTEDTDSGFDSLEIVLSLDCTSSMNYPATGECRAICGTSGSGYQTCMVANSCKTRIFEMKRAALSFVDEVENFAGENRTKEIKLGVNAFKVDAIWVEQPSTNYAAVRNKVTNQLGDWHNTSSMCSFETSYTSVGSGFDLANQYLRTTKNDGKKQVIALISDGEPNSRHSSYTDPAVCGSETCSNCGLSKGNEYLACNLRTTNDSIPGVRDPEVDAYAVTVLDNPPPQVTNIFNTHTTGYYSSANATNLSGFLADIFEQITENFSTISIKRVVPTPVR